MRSLKPAIVLVLAILVVYASGSWYIASRATTSDRLLPEQTPASVGLQYRNVDFLSRIDSVKLKAWYIEQQGAKGVVIIVHGVDGNKSDETIGILQLARRLYDRGMGVFLFDLRGDGESGDGRLSGGEFEQRDLLAAFDWVVKQGVEPGRIGVLGFSLGGAISLLAASEEPRLQAVVADSAFAELSDVMAGQITNRLWIPDLLAESFVPGVTVAAQVLYGINLGSVAPEKAIAQLPYPVLLIHSRDDDTVPYESSERLKAASPNRDTLLWIVDKAGHAKAFMTYPDEYVDRVTKYFESRWQ